MHPLEVQEVTRSYPKFSNRNTYGARVATRNKILITHGDWLLLAWQFLVAQLILFKHEHDSALDAEQSHD